MTDTKHETKQNASHTPGPWKDDSTGSIFGDMNTDHDGDNPFVADTRVDRKKERTPEEIANARLIVAAPKLLAAIHYLLEQTVDMDLKYGIGLSEGEEDARQQALAVIAEAAGDSIGRLA